MKNIDIVVMGKTGAGKSTLINAILEEDVAPVGSGQAVTKENAVYSKQMLLPLGENSDGKYGMQGCQLRMYDTVGLEIDNEITENTLKETRKHIEKTKKNAAVNDVQLVWFCVNYRSGRFEPYEIDLIRKMSIDYEIPFVIVITQCFEDEESELEIQIRENLNEVLKLRILAKEHKTRGGIIPAFGVMDLIRTSVVNYGNLKVELLERKIDELDTGRNDRINQIERRCQGKISDYVSAATKIGFVSGGCIPIVHGMCIKMIADLNKTAGFKSSKKFVQEIFTDAILGIVATPFMLVPLLSVAVASAYVQQVGDDYLKVMMNVIHLSSDRELNDNVLMQNRIKNELKK